MEKENYFFSNGKLMISGEYFVLDGALSLSLPTKFGQSLEFFSSNENISWKAFDNGNNIWIDVTFDNNLNIISTNIGDAYNIKNILTELININPYFTEKLRNKNIHTKMDFPLNWGLGSSSTLINNLSIWGKISPYLLLEKTFGGSGYDIAVAQIKSPTIFQLKYGLPVFQGTIFDKNFKENLFFVFLNEKQNSRTEIKKYNQIKKDKTEIIKKISILTQNIIDCINLDEFEDNINELENITSDFLEEKNIKEKMFSDFNGSIKSCGAWGGDFILVTGEYDYVKTYFNEKKYNTIFKYNDIIL